MIDLQNIDMNIENLKQQYANGVFTPKELLFALRDKALAAKDNPVWIHLLSEEELQHHLDRLKTVKPNELPLYGIPFAIKDNIDLANIPTTAACEAFTYTPDTSATVVQQLLQAGAIPLGKTNMDQFATGLVGTRSPEPWGACKNVFDSTVISGGSSSGSAVALALGLVSFSLGTDTAGSGRVPASLNNLVGLKASKGLLSTKGVVPACRSLDCVSIFALNTDDANNVLDYAQGFDAKDPYSRPNPYANSKRYYQAHKGELCLGVPRKSDLEFFGNNEAEQLLDDACEKLKEDGVQLKTLDFSPFLQAAKLLYEGPWVAERWLATQDIITTQPTAMLPVIQTIIGGGAKGTAAEAFSAQYKLQALKLLADELLTNVDAIITPTNPCYFTHDDITAEPIKANSQLGYYTNFMNLLDYSAIACPTGFYKNNVGFGVTLFSYAFSDKRLLSIAARIQNMHKLNAGNSAATYTQQGNSLQKLPTTHTQLVVCGAHLSGLPLNWQLSERGAVLSETTTTSKHYSFYALAGGPPQRPGLVRTNNGAAIDVEVWNIPTTALGSFLAEIPAPLGIGKVELADGRWVSGFICDAWGLEGAEDITHHKSWREYLKAS